MQLGKILKRRKKQKLGGSLSNHETGATKHVASENHGFCEHTKLWFMMVVQCLIPQAQSGRAGEDYNALEEMERAMKNMTVARKLEIFGPKTILLSRIVTSAHNRSFRIGTKITEGWDSRVFLWESHQCGFPQRSESQTGKKRAGRKQRWHSKLYAAKSSADQLTNALELQTTVKWSIQVYERTIKKTLERTWLVAEFFKNPLSIYRAPKKVESRYRCYLTASANAIKKSIECSESCSGADLKTRFWFTKTLGMFWVPKAAQCVQTMPSLRLETTTTRFQAHRRHFHPDNFVKSVATEKENVQFKNDVRTQF